MKTMNLIILDRDGVINYDSDQFIKNPEEWKPIPGSLEAIARLCQADYRVVVATNQSGIGRGLFDMHTLNAIHDKMHKAVALAGGRIDAIFYCPHTAECRLPLPQAQAGDAGRYCGTLQRQFTRRTGSGRFAARLGICRENGCAADIGTHRQGGQNPGCGRAAGRHVDLPGFGCGCGDTGLIWFFCVH